MGGLSPGKDLSSGTTTSCFVGPATLLAVWAGAWEAPWHVYHACFAPVWFLVIP